MFASLAKILTSSKSPKSAPKPKKTTRSLQMETMEARQLMAVTNIQLDYSSVYQTKQVWISSDNRASDVSISLSNNQIQVKDAVNGFNRSLPATGIQAVVFMGGKGNDKVTHQISNVSLRAYGFGGDDVLIGHSAHDILDGGDGNDRLYGNNGNDKLMGGAGVDKLFGGNHDDYLNGGSGRDEFYGGHGYDTYRRSLTVGGFFATDPEDEKADEPVEVTGSFLVNDRASGDSQWDIDQTESPTCSFLAALSAVAEKTTSSNDLVRKIRYDSAKDMYGVPIYHKGSWRTEWVNGDWTAGRDPGGRLWVTLYQKAYLQAWGVKTRDGHGRLLAEDKWVSTQGTGWRNAGSAMDAIAPGFSKYVSMNNANASTIRSQTRDTKVFGMVASSKSSGTTSGVVSNHAYMVYDAYTQNGTWMIRLYNPWARDGVGSSTDGRDEGLVTLTWNQFKANFNGYYYNVK